MMFEIRGRNIKQIPAYVRGVSRRIRNVYHCQIITFETLAAV